MPKPYPREFREDVVAVAKRREPGVTLKQVSDDFEISETCLQNSLRYDRVDTDGHVSLRHAAHMHHLGIGRRHTGKRVLILIDETTATVTHLDTGEILSTHTIDPARGYWRNTQREPGRWPGSRS